MNRKLTKALAVTVALACTGLALAQDTTGTTLFGITLPDFLGNFSLSGVAGIIGPVAGILLFLLFARFGGFRWLY